MKHITLENLLEEGWVTLVSNVYNQPAKPDLTTYYKLVEEKDAYRENWNCLLHEVRASSKFGRIRDMEFSTGLHAFKLVLPLKDSAHQGIMLCISMMKKHIGLYFSDLNKEALVPIMNCIFPFQVSYYPFSQEQASLGRQVLDLALKHFPDFQKFDNAFASEEISDVMIGSDYFKKIDPFQAVFTTNVHGVI
ncbi:hypothetical protein K3G39_05105 [Pontibacter sp. HSC-14F20]|uniref:hypothetical protein n=1 Tax=Pontibacter sp. HSC-14F20 TaxID=2864136 RepID=UPI001C730562|nr:hypothetical protein [Pontibacter sp. HSC-14F20]MBX0332609.1 hypothetical protein [Pontibacter sp. HSC-14F20]